jgi:hypothetical protein
MAPIQLHADDSGFGVLLSRIANEDDAESVHAFFVEKGIAATIVPFCQPGDYRVFVSGVTMDAFHKLVECSSISLV